MRRAFEKTLVELGSNFPELVVLSVDYESGVGSFKTQFRDRYINMGCSEQSTISAAAGMAIEGLRPIIYSITPFILERAFEQVKIDIAEQGLPVILVGFDDYPTQGPTHASVRPDLLVQTMPKLNGYFPTNGQETSEALIRAFMSKKPSLIRLQRDRILDYHNYQKSRC